MADAPLLATAAPPHNDVKAIQLERRMSLVTGIPADAKLVAGWKKDNPGKAVGSFGPPSYGAAQIAMTAIAKACKAGGGSTTRAAVFHTFKKVSIKNWILGGTFKWSTKSNDPLNAKFYIFQIQSNGSYKLVG